MVLYCGLEKEQILSWFTLGKSYCLLEVNVSGNKSCFYKGCKKGSVQKLLAVKILTYIVIA
jgi:hypothetical protein